MEIWAQVCSGSATFALLTGSVAQLATKRLGKVGTGSRMKLVARGWLGLLLVSVVALLLSVLLRGLNRAPLGSVGDRAAVVALAGALARLAHDLRAPSQGGQGQMTWIGLVPLAIMSAISVGRWPAGSSSAPLLLVFTLLPAGLGLWAAGQLLEGLMTGQRPGWWSGGIPFAGLTGSVAVIAVANWRMWGTPSGSVPGAPGSRSWFLGLVAVWLVSAASLVLGRRPVRLFSGLGFLAMTVLVIIALSVRWTLPFA